MVFYRQQMVIGGDFAMVTAVPVTWQPKNRSGERRRRQRCKPTKEAQAWGNRRRAEERLFYLVHENFTLADCRLDLDFRDGNLPQNPEDFKRIMRNFWLRARHLYEKAGLTLKYLWIPEQSAAGRYHVHGFISGGIDPQALAACWRHGRCNTAPLQYDGRGLAGYIHYVCKNPLLFKRWSGSRNLKKPRERQSDYTLDKRDVLAAQIGDFSALEKRLKGWRVLEVQTEADAPTVENWRAVEARADLNEVNGLPYLFVRLCRREAALSW